MQHALAALGLRAGGFDEAGLRAAFRREALRAHPDKGGSDDVFRRLAAAYKLLRRWLRGDAPPPPEHHEARRASAEAFAGGAGEPAPPRGAPPDFNAAFERRHARPDDGLGAWLAAEVPAAARCKARVGAKAFAAEFARAARRAPLQLAAAGPPVEPSAGCTLAPARAAGAAGGPDDFGSEWLPGARPALAYSDLRSAHGGAVTDPAAAAAAARGRRAVLERCVRMRLGQK